MSERIIIGEGERAGHPISAPVEKDSTGFPSTMIRWRHTGTCFVLEQFIRNVHPTAKPDYIWIEVPCVMPEQGSPIQATVTLTGKCKACGETVSPHVEFCQSCTGENES